MPQAVVSTFDVIRFVPAPVEYAQVNRSRTARAGAGRLIVALHGRAPNDTTNQAGALSWGQHTAGAGRVTAELVNRDYVVMGISAGGPTTYANQQAVDAVRFAIDFARTKEWCHPTAKVALWGYSMGGGLAVNFMRKDPSAYADVAACLLNAPALPLAHLFADARYTAEITGAYPGYPTGYSTWDPYDYATSFAIPYRATIANDDVAFDADPAISSGYVKDFHAASPSPDKALSVFEVGNHTQFWNQIDATAWANWLDSLDWND
jgi:alpha-beta hydrolase superfamily lysophospholipase